MNTDKRFNIRELSPEHDLQRWLRLVQAVEIEDKGAPETTIEHLHQALASGRGRRWIAEDPSDLDTLVGYALLYPQIPERSHVNVLIHPRSRRCGLGSSMLALLNTEALQAGARWTYNEIDERDTAAIAFLRHNGFQSAGDVWLLRADAEANFAGPTWPPGYTVRSYAEVGDLQILTDACNIGFGDMWGHHENTAGGVTPEHVSKWIMNWDHNAIFLAFAPDGSVIGFCKAASQDAEDLVDEPGIAPEHRYQQLQRPMVLTALRWLRGKARRPVRLESWGDTPETVDLYKEIGFELIEHYISLRYTLSGE